MNILIDLVPKEINIDGTFYPINSCFRTCILFEELMSDSNFTDEEKAYMSLELFYPTIPKNLQGAVEGIQWFYRGGTGKEIEEEEEGGENAPRGNTGVALYSYLDDADYIYSAFLDQYGIDLQDIEELHWWKFKALFKGLKEDNKISKIMGYRSIKIDKDMSKEQKSFYKEMKKIYALPDKRTIEEKEKDFHDTLSNII